MLFIFYHEEHEGLEDMHWVPKLELGSQQITLFDKLLNSLPFIIFMSFMVIKTSYKHCTASAPTLLASLARTARLTLSSIME
jgi:hypothetical protein